MNYIAVHGEAGELIALVLNWYYKREDEVITSA